MSQFTLLRARRFAPLFWTQFLGAFNDNIYRFALIIFVAFTIAERTGLDTRMLVVLSGGVFVLPFFLFSALAGQLADKYEKSLLIRRIKSAEIVIMGLGAIGFWLGNYTFLLAVLFLMGTQSTFFGPLKYGILPQHLAERELTGGNGLIQMGTYVAILLGGMLGGMLAGLERGPLAVIAAVLAIAALGRASAGLIPPAMASAPDLAVDFNPLRSTWRLLAEALQPPALFTLIGLISTFWFLGATFLSVVPTYGKELLHADERAVTLLNVAFTLGIGIGSLACERLSRGRIEIGLVPLAALGLSLAALDVWLAGVPPRPAAELGPAALLSFGPALRLFIDLTLIGACGALYIVPLYADLQARIDAPYRARTIAALNIANALFMVVSAVFTMALYAVGVGVTGVFGIAGLVNLCALAAGLYAMPELRARGRAYLRRGAV